MCIHHRFLSVLMVIVAGLAQAAAAPLGDRLVIAINGTPYTQGQVEIYILVKECLRKETTHSIRYVQKDNWNLALRVFAWDMLVEQEASRFGSFQVNSKNLDKFKKIVLERIRSDAALQSAANRLGLDERTLNRSLATVLRIEAFRSNKDRQVTVGGAEVEAKDGATSKWLQDLEQRSIIRLFEGAMEYIPISPVLAKESNDK